MREAALQRVDRGEAGAGERAGARDAVIDVRGLKTYFPIKQGLFSKTVGYVRAVDDVSLQMYAGETLGLVGESGCGKTTLGRSMLRLVAPTAGSVSYKGRDLLKLGDDELRTIRGELQIVFQDPYSSLNPRMTVAQTLGEVLRVSGRMGRAAANERLNELLVEVGLSPLYASRYPHEFSGGQRQRIAIARAIALNPAVVVCDEPVSGLDVSIQSQVINLLIDIKQDFGMTYLFISHDLKVVQHISDRVAVMYLGAVMEIGPTDSLFDHPLHPYTQALLSAALTLDRAKNRERIILEGETPSASTVMPGCRFSGRCWKSCDRCRSESPELSEASPGHSVACFYPDDTPGRI